LHVDDAATSVAVATGAGLVLLVLLDAAFSV